MTTLKYGLFSLILLVGLPLTMGSSLAAPHRWDGTYQCDGQRVPEADPYQMRIEVRPGEDADIYIGSWTFINDIVARGVAQAHGDQLHFSFAMPDGGFGSAVFTRTLVGMNGTYALFRVEKVVAKEVCKRVASGGAKMIVASR